MFTEEGEPLTFFLFFENVAIIGKDDFEKAFELLAYLALHSNFVFKDSPLMGLLVKQKRLLDGEEGVP